MRSYEELRQILLSLPTVSLQASQTDVTELTAPWRPYQIRGEEAPTQALGRAAYDSDVITGFVYPSTATRRLQRPTLGVCFALFLDRFSDSDFVEVSEPEKYRKRIP